MVRIDLAPLAEGVHHLELQPAPEMLDLDPALFADINVEIVLDYHNDRALVTLTASATATLECDRTLVDFEQPIEGTYQVLYVPPAFARRAPEASGDDEDVLPLDPSDPTLDLTEAVRDTLLLAIPARKVAPGAEDAELQTRFGDTDEDGNPRPDPRWAALQALRDADADGADG